MEGYTPILEQLLDQPSIDLYLNQKMTQEDLKDYDHVFFSGPIDAYFNFEKGRLNYRSLDFKEYRAKGDYQGNAVINYCELSVPHTRISEHKHFAPWESSSFEDTLYFEEFSKKAGELDIPYYPMRLADDKPKLSHYFNRARMSSKVTFIGRLGTYRYLDMHVVIKESLDLARTCKETDIESWPIATGNMAL